MSLPKIGLAFGTLLTGMLSLAFAATISGTILWALWEYIFDVIPGVTECLTTSIGWFEAVAVAWISGIIFGRK